MRHPSKRRLAVAFGGLLLSMLPLVVCVNDANRPMQYSIPEKPTILVYPSDTAIAINDTLLLRVANTSSRALIAEYQWSAQQGTPSSDTTSDSTWRVWWGRNQTGLHAVVVRATSDDGLVSQAETACVEVLLRAPTVWVAARETLLTVNDTLYVFAVARDTNGTVLCQWSVDGGRFGIPSADSLLVLSWGIADTGVHVVRVRAIDDDSLLSLVDSVVVWVIPDRPTVALAADTFVFVSDTLIARAKGRDVHGSVVAYVWTAGAGLIADTSQVDSLVLVPGMGDTGTLVIYVVALDDDGLTSAPESLVVRVDPGFPSVTMRVDSVVWAFDTLVVRATGVDPRGSVIGYVWAVGERSLSDTTTADSLVVVPGLEHVGRLTARVKAIDDDGLVSRSDSTVVTVRLGVPRVRLGTDTVVWINDTLKVVAEASDTNGTIAAFRWVVNDSIIDDTTLADTLTVVFGPSDSGVATVLVVVSDNDGLVSQPASMLIRVHLGRPVVVAPRDTLVGTGDTLDLAVTASDSNGVIVGYYWDLDGDGWDDSTSQPTYRLWFRGRDPQILVVGARDDDGYVDTDTVRVFFGPPALRVRLFAPGDTNHVHLHDSSFVKGSVRFSFGCMDPYGVCRVAEYVLYLGTHRDTMAVVYRGAGTEVTLTGLDTAVYHWMLKATDPWGFSALSEGTFVNVLSKDICFVGHSIVCGLGTDVYRGGFRSIVLDSLRSRTHGLSTVRPVGPITTPFWPGSPDDSCLALSGSFAQTMYDSLRMHPELNADEWVVMTGVNGDYFNFWERYYTSVLLESIYRRNSRAPVYVLTGLQVPDTTTFERQQRLYDFNLMLANTAEDWDNGGRHMVLVDAFAALSPDSVFPIQYMMDNLHPNDAGYAVLGRTILNAMGFE